MRSILSKFGASICLALLVAACITDQPPAPPQPLAGYVPRMQREKTFEQLKTEAGAILTAATEIARLQPYMGAGRVTYYPFSGKIEFRDEEMVAAFRTAGIFDDKSSWAELVSKEQKRYDAKLYEYRFDYHELAAVTFGEQNCTDTTAPLPQNVRLRFDHSVGPEVCDTLYSLGQRFKQVREAEAAAFTELAAKYRGLNVKPTMSEEQRRFVVQGEALRQRKDYAPAAEMFRAAIGLDPVAYPAAHFNLALLYEQMESYPRAIEAMRRYLALQPAAQDARAAQDKIYEWEMLAKNR